MPRKIKYSDSNFDSIVAELQSKLSATDTWKDAYRSAAGQTLIELFAYIGDMLSYKIERVSEELDPRYARLPSSIRRIAALLGYKPRRKVSSVVTLKFYLDDPAVSNILIPEGTECSADDDTKFVTTEDATISAGTTETTVIAMQGEIKTQDEVSDGQPNQFFLFPDVGEDFNSVENTSVSVTVNGVEWEEVSSFLGADSDDRYYTLRTIGDRLRIDFGDGNYGDIPPDSVDIQIKWVESEGRSGNVFGTDKITEMTNPIGDVAVTNTDDAVGGQDEEDVEEIRENAPKVFATGDRAVTREDYKAILLATEGVDKANAYGEQEMLEGASSNPDYAWRVALVIVPASTVADYTALKTTIENFLESKKCITAEIIWVDPVLLEVDIVTNFVITRNADSEEVLEDIQSALDELLDYQTLDLGDDLRHSDVGREIDDVEGVNYHDTKIFLGQDLEEDVPGTWSGTLSLLPVVSKSVTLYRKDIDDNLEPIGYDNGEGDLIIDGAVSGSINYITGIVSVNESWTGDDIMRVRYNPAVSAATSFGTGDGVETVFGGVLKYPVVPNAVEIYTGETLIGEDDGSGNIVWVGGAGIDGTIEYDRGRISIELLDAPTSGVDISARYYYDGQDVVTETKNLLRPGINTLTLETR